VKTFKESARVFLATVPSEEQTRYRWNFGARDFRFAAEIVPLIKQFRTRTVPSRVRPAHTRAPVLNQTPDQVLARLRAQGVLMKS
jgi:hypothetical protein